ncbi:MAG: ABC transporter permease [Burkholderiales bacterium]|nr:ABC transporter permease [Anaerolineae bacterium]
MSDITSGDAPPRPKRSGLQSIRVPEEIGVIAALLVLVTIISIHNSAYIAPANLLRLLTNTTFYGIIALGMVYLLAIREIDLSVGWMFNFSAVVAAILMRDFGVDPWIAAGAGVLFGALLGLFNGLVAIGLNLPAIIVTLGTYSMFRGLSLVVNQSAAVIPPDDTGSFFQMATAKIPIGGGETPLLEIPLVAIIFLVMAIVLHLVLHRTRFGYRVQAVGSNPEAARLAGIPISLVRLQTLVLVGAICGFSGSLFVGFRGAIDTNSGQDFALTVVAAVIIGGTPLSGGWGTVIGALIGALIIAVISSGIIFFGIDQKWSTFVTGAVIVLAVAVDQLVKRQRAKRLMASRIE